MKIAIEHALGYESLDAQILCDLSSFHSLTLTSHLFFLLPSLPVVGHTGSCAPATRGYAPPVLVLISANTILNLGLNVYKKP